jgi:hypothetical protein
MVTTSTPGIFKRGGRFVVVVRQDGKQVKRSTRTLAEARAVKAELTAAANRGEPIRESRKTVESYFRGWIDRYKGRTRHGLRASSREGYRASMELHVLPTLGRSRLSALRPRDLDRLEAALLGKGSRTTACVSRSRR